MSAPESTSEVRTTDSSTATRSGSYYVFSHKPPEEAQLFGLRGADIEQVWSSTEEDAAASPDDLGFNESNEDGICKYCQLMLSPEAPDIVQHQPSLVSLIQSSCRVCAWVEESLVKGCPRLVAGFRQGDPKVCDPKGTSSRVSIALERRSNFTRAIATVGVRHHLTDKGVPLNLTTSKRLGALFSRRFWEPYNEQIQSTSVRRLPVIKTWVDECRVKHPRCSNAMTRLPTRVLDLTGSLAVPSTFDDIKVRLKETSTEEMGEYVALSYCWGNDTDQHFKTTTQNIEQHKHKIDFNLIPLLQREAILTALFIGIRYLWIDSLCIIQDDSKDWEKEAGTMDTVYSNAALTFAATSSPSCSDGLLLPFQAACCVRIHDDLAIVRMETHTKINTASEPLNTRAWTLQESVLSPRTISFGSEQWLWRCSSRYTTEDGLIDRPEYVNDGIDHWHSIVRQHEVESKALEYLPHWYRLLENYCRRNLSFQSDKLRAIAGLADAFAKQTGYDFIVGLWVQDISHGLMWTATSRGVTRNTNTTMPSWSWASVTGPIRIERRMDEPAGLVHFERIHLEWQGEPLTSTLKVAALHVTGHALTARLGNQSVTQPLRYHITRDSEDYELLGEAFLDNQEPILEDVKRMTCLHLHSSNAVAPEHYVLLLVPDGVQCVNSTDQTYRRIGVGVMWETSRTLNGGQSGSDTLKNISLSNMVLV